MTFRIAPFISVALLVLIGIWGWFLSLETGGRALAFSLLAGAAFGIVLQRGRFCFLCNFRDLVEKREAGGVIAILLALAAGTVFYQIVMASWAPVPQPGRLPPGAHIGPVGWVLALAATVFGLGTALSGSCLSAHFYRLGEGAFGSLVALSGAAIGFLIGFASWNSLYTVAVYDDPPLWLPHSLGYTGALIFSLTLLAGLTIASLWWSNGRLHPSERVRQSPSSVTAIFQPIFKDRWPPVVTGILIAAISAFAYFRVAPLGVTQELGSLVRTGGFSLGLVPETLAGLDTARGCISAIKTTLLSPNGLFVSGLILASFACALIAGQFKPTWPNGRGLTLRFIGGLLMGWGGTTALGCTVGVLLSGIHAGAVSGWVFLLFCALGTLAGLRLVRAITR
ncbi:YeeE/YedE family protein [Agrobacterium larrymoorei]|uniref:YeeE/YedE family protein n=1 Tax=Agrobacterium larrymoorei TaxID=160699 RepID=UPI0030BE708A